MTNNFKPRIVIICANIVREYAYQSYLKKTLEAKFPCRVTIIGSLADHQRTLYLLYKIRPSIVILPQIQEQPCRSVARYVKKSGGTVCVIPSEITYSTSDGIGLINKRMVFNTYIDHYFLPGEQMFRDVCRSTDITKNKIHITGSPKIDLVCRKSRLAEGRDEIVKKYRINTNTKVIGIFSSFVTTPLAYMRKDKTFKGKIQLIQRRDAATLETQNKFVSDIDAVCKQFPDYQFILKTHPMETDIGIYKNMAARNIILMQNELLTPVLSIIDLGIHFNSTVATECWISKIPTIQFAPNSKVARFLSDFKIGNPVVQTKRKLHDYIEKYLAKTMESRFKKEQKVFLQKWYYKLDGRSAERIANYLNNLQESKILKRTNYRSQVKFMYYFFLALEKIFGIYVSRRISGFMYKDYNWKYASDNDIYID